MPDRKGNFKGISVPRLPWVQETPGLPWLEGQTMATLNGMTMAEIEERNELRSPDSEDLGGLEPDALPAAGQEAAQQPLK